MYKSLTAQTIHYFSRPHSQIARAPLSGPAVWRGDELHDDQWLERFTDGDIDEIDRALAVAARSGRPRARLRPQDFPLPTLTRKIARWRREIDQGLGFRLLRGLPVRRWTTDQAETFFWAFGLHYGTPGAQNPEGDLLGHVRDTGANPDEVRHYRTNTNINFHCDAADVVGLFCLRAARRGGESRIVSSLSVYNELLARQPDAVARLYEPVLMDTKGEGGVRYLPVRPCRYDGQRLRTFYHTDYFRTAVDHTGRNLLSDADRQVLDLYNEIAGTQGLYLDMELAPGDVQLVSNHAILHARTGYEDHVDPEERRHLLRLWISTTREQTWRQRLQTQRSRAEMVYTAVREKLRYRFG